ncbi:MAG: spheroidene monooxygenase [Actinobacteria bacterium]|nr:spheroidene monooxygenase [Actinomycetota bacterium]MBV8960841.1 spheroidene monooxygenase [Actinomycetota bacterium]MBV9254649.1 spheroidene monooxygenase [Actinomycetota bacterium]MBV9662671.1 spheroidene monooxygenase [Actinomycetota bacterium]MBV9934755.1 spheroidene monooxygenase [Actinomycetota bacterium]
MIATIDVADIGVRSTMRSLRRRPGPGDVPGLRWLDVAPAVPLAGKRPPGLRRAVLLAMWDDEDAAATFTDTHPLARRFADGGFHAVLRPLRAFGSWPGLPEDVPRNRVTHHEGPVMVATLGRLRLSQTLRFLRASRPAERAAIDADGFLWGTAAARPPFVATVSVWSSDDAAAAYAYGDAQAGHPQAIARQRKKDFHQYSAFIRYAIVSTTGAVSATSPVPDVGRTSRPAGPTSR